MLPEVPTVTETGVANFVYESWNGVAVPAGTPPEIVQRLNAEIVKLVALPEVRDRLIALGYDPATNTSAEFAAQIQSDYERFGKLVKDIGLRAGQ